jgi:hypothetical protein
MKKITTDQTKINLIGKLVMSGAISYEESLLLLEVETHTEYLNLTPYQPQPWETTTPIYAPPYKVICDGTTGTATVYPNAGNY